MKVKIIVNGKSSETDADSFEKAFEHFEKFFADSEIDTSDTSDIPQKNDPKVQEYPLWAKIGASIMGCGCLFVLGLLILLGIIVAI